MSFTPDTDRQEVTFAVKDKKQFDLHEVKRVMSLKRAQAPAISDVPRDRGHLRPGAPSEALTGSGKRAMRTSSKYLSRAGPGSPGYTIWIEIREIFCRTQLTRAA